MLRELGSTLESENWLQPDQGVVRLPASQPRWFRAFEFVLSQRHVEGAAEGGEGVQVLGTCECLVGLR